MLKPLDRRVSVHEVRLALTSTEWAKLEADAREAEITVDQLLSLVVAYATRARILHAASLALSDILPWSRLPGEPQPEAGR